MRKNSRAKVVWPIPLAAAFSFTDSISDGLSRIGYGTRDCIATGGFRGIAISVNDEIVVTAINATPETLAKLLRAIDAFYAHD
jgi:hypothetical protein